MSSVGAWPGSQRGGPLGRFPEDGTPGQVPRGGDPWAGSQRMGPLGWHGRVTEPGCFQTRPALTPPAAGRACVGVGRGERGGRGPQDGPAEPGAGWVQRQLGRDLLEGGWARQSRSGRVGPGLGALTGLAEQGHAEHQEGSGELHGGWAPRMLLDLTRCPESGPGASYTPSSPLPGAGPPPPCPPENLLFAQLMGRAPANFLLSLVGPGKPVPPTLPGSRDFLLAGPG